MPQTPSEAYHLFKKRHPERHAANKENSRRIIRERKEMLKDIKADRGCLYCGVHHPLCLDFHHRDPTLKSFSVSTVHTTNISRLMEEVEKCGVVCRNCHMLLHAGLDPSSWRNDS